MLKDLSLQDGGTFAAPTGGTTKALKSQGTGFNESRFILDDGTSLEEQTNVRFFVTPPAVNSSALGGYTQGTRRFTIFEPHTLSSGEKTLNSVEVKVRCDRSTPDADVLALARMAADILINSESEDFLTDLATG